MLNTWNQHESTKIKPPASVDATESSGSKAVKALKGSGCLQSGIMGFPLKGRVGGIFLLQREGLLGKKIFKMYPLHGTRIHIPASLVSLENSSTQKCRLMGSGDMRNRGTQGLVTHPRSWTWQDTDPQQLHEKQYHLRITWSTNFEDSRVAVGWSCWSIQGCKAHVITIYIDVLPQKYIWKKIEKTSPTQTNLKPLKKSGFQTGQLLLSPKTNLSDNVGWKTIVFLKWSLF